MERKVLNTLIALFVIGTAFAAVAGESAKDSDKQASKKVQKQRPRMDVVFAIDATGSMSDEIEVIKKEVWQIANTILAGQPSPDVRFGLVFYKDQGEAFVVRSTDLTRDIDKIHELLMSTSVSGGGDNPEHVGAGLHEALGLSWEKGQGISRTIYLVGDAPGHTDYDDGLDVSLAVQKAKKMGVTIQAIGCSGISSDAGREQFANIATQTGGKFDALTYHSIVKGDDGKDRSVVYYDGAHYEADKVLSDKEWKGGGEKLKKSKKVRRASASSSAKAAAAPKTNNLDAVVESAAMDEAESMGVSY